MAYIDVTIETEPVDLAADAFTYIQNQVPGWLPAEGNLESWLVESLAQIAGELRVLAGLVPEDIFTFFGSTIMGLPPFGATAATGTTTWTMIDTAGYTIPAGTIVAVQPPASTDSYGFQVTADLVIAAGQTVGTATIQALEPGAAASGITGTVTMIDILDFVSQITLTAPTTGGQDAELADAYLDRLSDLMTLLSPAPILPQDFATMAAREVAGVYRAVAIDLYKADTQQTNQPRCCTVVPVDANGQPVSATIKTEILNLLQANREINFLVYVADPTYTSIDVAATVTCYPSYDPTDVGTRVVANLTSWLQPANWGLPPFGDKSGISWVNETVVRYLEVAEQVNRTDGVRYIKTLTLNIDGQTAGSVDVPLNGVAPLTQPGPTITCTASLT